MLCERVEKTDEQRLWSFLYKRVSPSGFEAFSMVFLSSVYTFSQRIDEYTINVFS